MIKKLFAALVVSAFTAPAWAGSCPTLMLEVDLALEDEAIVAQLDQEALDRVQELRQEGEALHNAGDHDQSVATLNEAKDILGI
jgi:hypothetical protein